MKRLLSILVIIVELLSLASCGNSKVESVQIEKAQSFMTVGEEIDLSYSVTPGKAKVQNVEWKSSNSSVISVNDGHLVAQSIGICSINLSVNSSIQDEIIVVVAQEDERQARAIKKVEDFVNENQNIKILGLSAISVGKIDAETDFVIAVAPKGGLYLFAYKKPVDSLTEQYVLMRIESRNTENAMIIHDDRTQTDTGEVLIQGRGEISFSNYKLGKQVSLDVLTSSWDNKYWDLGDMYDYYYDVAQRECDEGVKNVLIHFKMFLETNSDLGISVNDFQLGAIYE